MIKLIAPHMYIDGKTVFRNYVSSVKNQTMVYLVIVEECNKKTYFKIPCILVSFTYCLFIIINIFIFLNFSCR